MIDNQSPFTAAWFRKRGPGALDFDVLAVRARYRIDAECQTLKLEPGALMRPVDDLQGDVAAEPQRALLASEGGLLLYKPSTDIHVVGSASAPNRQPTATWLAGVRVGDCGKMVRLTGPRRFQLRVRGWRASRPEPAAEVSLSYRQAYGGYFQSRKDDGIALFKPDNPAGCGWLPKPAQWRAFPKPVRAELDARILGITELAAPQIENPKAPVLHPEQALPAEGLGPVARSWAARAQYLGTRDAAWRASQPSAYPDDFDPRFFQSAAPGLTTAAYLKGGEPIVLAGLLPEGRVDLTLPCDQPTVVVVRDDASTQITRLVLDTVCIDLDTRQLQLTWRTSFACSNPVRHGTLIKEAA